MKTEDYREQAIEDLIKFSVQEAANELLDELPPPEEVEFSKEHEAKMQELFKTVGKKPKAKAKTKIRRIKPRWRVAIAVAIILGITIGSVGINALRVRFFNMFVNFTSSNTEIRYVEEDKENNSYSTDDVTLEYIPKDFKLMETENWGDKVYLNFGNGDLSFSLFIRRLKSISNIDTEESGADLIKINNFDSYIIQKDEIISISWNDEIKFYDLSGNISKDELIRIAENIKLKQN